MGYLVPAANGRRDAPLRNFRRRSTFPLGGGIDVRILIVDEYRPCWSPFGAALTAAGHEVWFAPGVRDALVIMAGGALDVIVTDLAPPGGDWRLIIEAANPRKTAAAVVVVT